MVHLASYTAMYTTTILIDLYTLLLLDGLGMYSGYDVTFHYKLIVCFLSQMKKAHFLTSVDELQSTQRLMATKMDNQVVDCSPYIGELIGILVVKIF